MKRSNLFRSSVVAAFIVTLITGGLVYSSFAGDQKDIVDTAIAAGSVQEQVLQNGSSWMQRAFVVNNWYISAYEPLRDFHDKIVGMLYVGILESKYTVLKEKLILLFMFGMLVSVAISSFLSMKVLRKEFWEPMNEGQKGRP